MSKQPPVVAEGYWVLGGRWDEAEDSLPWPRVYGPYRDYLTARASAGDLNDAEDPRADMKVSMQCAIASMPVAAVSMGGRPRVSSGSQMAVLGTRFHE